MLVLIFIVLLASAPQCDSVLQYSFSLMLLLKISDIKKKTKRKSSKMKSIDSENAKHHFLEGKDRYCIRNHHTTPPRKHTLLIHQSQ